MENACCFERVFFGGYLRRDSFPEIILIGRRAVFLNGSFVEDVVILGSGPAVRPLPFILPEPDFLRLFWKVPGMGES